MSDRIRRQHRYTITPEHFILDPRISDRAFRLWCRLDRYAGENEVAFPTRETLAIELDTSKASIDRAVKELVCTGWLSKNRRNAGDTNIYLLITAPPKDVERLAKAARADRVEASQPRRDKEREKRREKKRRESSVKPFEIPAAAQVSEGGVVMGDETPVTGGVVMGDETPVVTGDERGVVMGDDQKEAAVEGGIKEGRSDDSLRSSPGPSDAVLFESHPEPKNDRADVDGICKHLADRIVANDVKRPTIGEGWRDAARLMLDTDGRSLQQVHDMIEWATRHEFWRSNILSMPKLRKQFDQMRMQKESQDQSSGLRRGYDDVETWGRPGADDTDAPMSDEEVARFFGGGRADGRPANRATG